MTYQRIEKKVTAVIPTTVPLKPVEKPALRIGRRERLDIEAEVRALAITGGVPYLTLEVLLDIRTLLLAILDKK